MPKPRRCTGCERLLPRTDEYFYRKEGGPTGRFEAVCKKCKIANNKDDQRVRRETEGANPHHVEPVERDGITLNGKSVMLGLCMSDTHIPEHDRRVLDSICQYLHDERWDMFSHLGDLIDCAAISSFNAGKPRRILKSHTVIEEYDAARLVLGQLTGAARNRNPDCACSLFEGNHEERTERYVDAHPELEGLVDVEKGLALKEAGVQYVRFWSAGEMLKWGKLRLGHGRYAVSNHAAKHVRDYGCSMLYGHTHDVQRFSVRQLGKGKPLMAESIGCTCNYNQTYMQGRPHNWQHAFAVVYVFPDGSFQHHVVPVISGRFIGPTNGKIYGGG